MSEPAKPRDHQASALERLVVAGVVRLPQLGLAEALAERGPLVGNVSRAGSDAVAEQRGERG